MKLLKPQALFLSFLSAFLGTSIYLFGQTGGNQVVNSDTITYEDIKPILESTCTERCHRKGKKVEWAPLTSYKEIMDGSAVKGKDCEDVQHKKYVVPGKPMESLLYLKLLEKPPCGKRMPRGSGKKPTEKDIEMIYRWIEQGALERKTL